MRKTKPCGCARHQAEREGRPVNEDEHLEAAYEDANGFPEDESYGFYEDEDEDEDPEAENRDQERDL